VALPDPDVPHCNVGPDLCFGCRTRFWRAGGKSPFVVPTHFRAANADGYSQAELGREIVAEAKRTGREIELQRNM